MTAIANPPSINRPFWNPNGSSHQPVGGPQQPDEFARAFLPPRGKPLERSNSVSSVSSNSSSASASTVLSTPQSNGSSVSSNGDASVCSLNTWTGPGIRKRPTQKTPEPWINGKPNMSNGRQTLVPGKPNGVNGAMHPTTSLPSAPGVGGRPVIPIMENGQPAKVVLCLLSVNSTFERKTISVPYYPETLRIGRQTNQKTIPTPTNGFFDSKVLSRQHAEIWADRETAKVFIRDVKSSNGTFVNSTRLSQENRESDPRELNVGDHLELGIDIVHENQKSVVHHKVAAKVEHVGFMSNTPELFSADPDSTAAANGNATQGQMQGRNRASSNSSVATNGRMGPGSGLINIPPNGMGPSRPGWMAQITTDQVVKKLHQEMRSSRLQAQDLLRTGQLVGAMLSKQDIKDLEKPEVPEPPRPHVNGTGPLSSFQARFLDPPAPPPQQPLPEKPDRNGDMASVMRTMPDKLKTRGENPQSQVIRLSDDLKNAKKELECQSARMRDLEDKLTKERVAREVAEELARRLEAASKVTDTESTARELDDAFNPPTETSRDTLPNGKFDPAASLQARLDAMMAEMLGLKQQLAEYKQRAHKAEEERDATRKSLSQMVIQIRDEQAARKAAEEQARSLKASRNPPNGTANGSAKQGTTPPTEARGATEKEDGSKSTSSSPSLSRSSTLTPAKVSGQLAQRHAAAQALPYASMLSVVVLGMGLMAYLNGWQGEARVQR